MKLWKYSLITAIGFIFISFSMVYTSCVDDSCETLLCRHDGVCVDGFCRCPDGYEGAQCEVIAARAFWGKFAGQSQIDGKPVFADTAYIRSSELIYDETRVDIKIYSRQPEVITGKVIGEEAFVTDTLNKKVIVNLVQPGVVEVTIEEDINGQLRITNFQGTKYDL